MIFWEFQLISAFIDTSGSGRVLKSEPDSNSGPISLLIKIFMLEKLIMQVRRPKDVLEEREPAQRLVKNND